MRHRSSPAQEPQPSSKEIVPITVNDLQVIEPGEMPRVRDVRLGERLGYDKRTKIRELIETPRLWAELLRYGALPRRREVIQVGNGAQMEVEAYWPNEAQSLS